MRRIGIVLSLTILLFPAFVCADCVDRGRFTSWYLETPHTIVFYTGETPLARLEIPNCEVNPLSTIRLIKSYVCDSDEIMVDGVACLPYCHSGGIVLEGNSCRSRRPLVRTEESPRRQGYT